MGKLRGEKGSVAVEFAILMPLLFVFIFGIIEFGLALCNKQIITNACREGARRGIVYPAGSVSDDEIKETVSYYLQPLMPLDGVIDVDHPEGQMPGKPLYVTATYRYDFWALDSFIPGLGDSLTLSSQAVMIYE
ncbi:MAG: TadE family protein [bacterium]